MITEYKIKLFYVDSKNKFKLTNCRCQILDKNNFKTLSIELPENNIITLSVDDLLKILNLGEKQC